MRRNRGKAGRGTGPEAFPGLAARHARISNDGVEVLKATTTTTSKRYGMCTNVGRIDGNWGKPAANPFLRLVSAGGSLWVSDYASCGHKFILKDVRC